VLIERHPRTTFAIGLVVGIVFAAGQGAEAGGWGLAVVCAVVLLVFVPIGVRFAGVARHQPLDRRARVLAWVALVAGIAIASLVKPVGALLIAAGLGVFIGLVLRPLAVGGDLLEG
jgi:hypothetical protein